MPSDTSHNGPASGTTSSDKQPAGLGEAEYLKREADDARQAITRTLEQMRDSLGDAADLGAWTQRYPWATLGASLAAGFVVAAAFVPSKRRERDEDEEPALLERILADEQIATRLKELAEEDDGKHHRPGGGMLKSVAGTLWSTFGPAVQSAVAAALAAKATQDDEENSPDAAQPDPQQPHAESQQQEAP